MDQVTHEPPVGMEILHRLLDSLYESVRIDDAIEKIEREWHRG